MEDPLVTVCIPTYNRADMVVHSVCSILWQTYARWRLLIYDDGSTDDTVSKLMALFQSLYVEEQEKITLVVAAKHRGHGHVRSWIRENVQTEWAALQDSDDMSHPERLEVQVKAVQEQNLDVCFTWLRKFRETSPDGAPLGISRVTRRIDLQRWTKNLAVKSVDNNTNTPTTLFNGRVRAMIPTIPINHGGFDGPWHFAMVQAGVRAGCVEDVLYYLRDHGGRLVKRKRDPRYKQVKAEEQLLIAQMYRDLGAVDV